MVDEHDIDDPERPRGLFSPADRKYLLGESEIKPKTQAERNRRAYIRERLTHTLLDFALVSEIEARDRRRVFERQDNTEAESKRLVALQQSIMDLLGFLYQELEQHHDTGMSFEECLRTGILRTRFRSETMQTVSPGDVTFEVEEPEEIDIDSVAMRLSEGGLDALSDGELRTMFRLLAEEREGMSPADLGDELLALKESGILDQ